MTLWIRIRIELNFWIRIRIRIESIRIYNPDLINRDILILKTYYLKSRAAAIDEPVDDLLAGGEVGSPVQLEPVVHLQDVQQTLYL
jgi:hypothetical protein